MTLSDYVKLHHAGNRSAFAKALGCSPGQVRRMLLPRSHRDHRSPLPWAARIKTVTANLVTADDLVAGLDEVSAQDAAA